MVSSLAGKVALVTGSSRGIGKAIATLLTKQGCRVVIHSRHSREAGQALANTLLDACYFSANLGEQVQCKHLIDEVIKHYGQLDILVNNAGHSVRKPLEDLDGIDDIFFQEMLQANLFSAWYLTRYAARYLKASASGSVVNISSIAGIEPVGSSIPYSVSKAALNHLTRLLAKVLAPEIRVNAIAPGFVLTERTKDWPEVNQTFSEKSVLKRAGEPQEIAEAVLGMVRCTYITGQILEVDG